MAEHEPVWLDDDGTDMGPPYIHAGVAVFAPGIMRVHIHADVDRMDALEAETADRVVISLSEGLRLLADKIDRDASE